jgi:hypothetical protein
VKEEDDKEGGYRFGIDGLGRRRGKEKGRWARERERGPGSRGVLLK